MKLNLIEIMCIVYIICIVLLLCIGEKANIDTWESFKTSHNCKIVEYREGKTTTGFSTSGNFKTYQTSDQECWLCDDGVKYWRNK